MSTACGTRPRQESASGRLEVFLHPEELTDAEPQAAAVVVIDVIRACTSIVAALGAGAVRVLPAATIAEARQLAEERRELDPLLCGERGGVRIDEFDLGNSPGEYTPSRVAGRTLIWSSTNGTRAICRAASLGAVRIGCFRNLSAMAAHLKPLLSNGQPVVVLCSGRAGRVSMDDTLCAGHLVERLVGDVPRIGLVDGARVAREFARAIGPPTPQWLRTTSAGRALVGLGLEADLDACAELDSSAIVPIMEGRGIVGRGRG